ncbi:MULTISPECIES: DUF2510 domain-containing protein [unclassified Salinibacterium]|uniref:DUF2510 domain-containing protein n=1 Tax=unclassified Salinibacterium TaxID=2632331 RepID=UPI001CD67F54|nr:MULTISPECIES: DUF2510 domain-containing protein [unclassified Salinibacterium]
MNEDGSVQPGWYPDPLGLPQLRWWDGQAWTEHTSDARRPTGPQVVVTTTFAEPVREAEPAYAEPVRAEAQAPVPPAEPVRPAQPAQPAAAQPATAQPAAATAPVADESGAPAKPAAQAKTATGPAALPAGTENAPELGWAGAALTLHSVQSARVPMVIELEIVGHPSMIVDTRYQAFTWPLRLDLFPENPLGVRVSVDLVEPLGEPAFELPGEALDALLWKIGTIAFPTRLAPWLNSTDVYRLQRWPNLTTLNPDMDQMRQAAMLSNGIFSVEQLAEFSGRSIETTRTLINALSLMNALEILPPEKSVQYEPPAPVKPDNDKSLFGRLRRRLGLG